MSSLKSGQKKLCASDISDAANIARAVSFTAYFRKGPHETYVVPVATVEEARAEAAKLEALHGKFGRRAMVYAVTPEGASFPMPR